MNWPPYQEYRPWTEKEIARFSYRLALFKRRGLEPRRAEKLAERLTQRDQERDSRRCCAECAHMRSDGTCFQAQQGAFPGARRMDCIPDLLARCPVFEFQVPA